jgi:adenylate cyclase
MPDNGITRFYGELKRRKVIRVAIAYVVVAWIVVEVASVMFPNMLLPDWSVRLVVGLAILGFPVALVLAWAVELTPDGLKREVSSASAGPTGQARPAVEGASKNVDSVAVLPFVNLSNDPDNEYFSDGISEELLNLLCKLPQLTVASRTSSFSFKGKHVDLPTVASQLGVDVILEGSVRRSGERVRITAQLIDARRDRHLWSETYDRDLKDVFAVQDEIARNIVKALELSLTPTEQRAIQKQASTTEMAAYDFYLRGRYFVERGEFDHGLKMFEEAIELDPAFAHAWAGAADGYSWRAQWLGGGQKDLQAADEYSRKALELAPDLAEAHASRCLALTLNEQFTEAEAEAAEAIRLDSRLYEAHYYLGRALFAQGKHHEAVVAFTRAGEIRPDDLAAATLKSTAVRATGNAAEMLTVVRHAIEVADRYLALNPDDALAMSRSAHDLISIGEADKGLQRAKRAYRINPKVCGYNVACAFAIAGDVEQALNILEEHLQTSGVQASWIENDSDWDAARNHPRFQALMRRLRDEEQSPGSE